MTNKNLNTSHLQKMREMFKFLLDTTALHSTQRHPKPMKIKKLTICLIASLLISIPAYGLMPSTPMVDYDMVNPYQTPVGPDQDVKKVEQIQSHFLEQIFTSKLFDQQDIFKADDQEEGFFSTSGTDLFIKDMLAREYAKALAKEDILGFKKNFLDQNTQTREEPLRRRP